MTSAGERSSAAQHARGGVRILVRARGQPVAQAQPHSADVLGAVAQVGVVHAAKQGAELVHRELEGPGGADLLALNASQGRIEQLGVAHDFHLGGNDVAVVRKIFGHVFHGALQGGAHIVGGGAQNVLLGGDLVRADAALLILAHAVHKAHRADGDAGRNGRAEK